MMRTRDDSGVWLSQTVSPVGGDSFAKLARPTRLASGDKDEIEHTGV